jgi:hypothetical protein
VVAQIIGGEKRDMGKVLGYVLRVTLIPINEVMLYELLPNNKETLQGDTM